MKNLHKKISAMLLAGMVVVGGFAASGVKSFAVSKGYSYVIQGQVQRVRSSVHRLGGVIVNFSQNRKDIGLGGRVHNIHSNMLDLNLYRLKNSRNDGVSFDSSINEKMFKIKVGSVYYLIKFN